MSATVVWSLASRLTSRTRAGGGISGSLLPMTASVGTCTFRSRSSEGKRVISLNRWNVLTGPKRR